MRSVSLVPLVRETLSQLISLADFDGMAPLRAWCYACLLPLAAVGCRTADVAAPPALSPRAVPQAAQVPPTSSRRTFAPCAGVAPAGQLTTVAFQNPLPAPPANSATEGVHSSA